MRELPADTGIYNLLNDLAMRRRRNESPAEWVNRVKDARERTRRRKIKLPSRCWMDIILAYLTRTEVDRMLSVQARDAAINQGLDQSNDHGQASPEAVASKPSRFIKTGRVNRIRRLKWDAFCKLAASSLPITGRYNPAVHDEEARRGIPEGVVAARRPWGEKRAKNLSKRNDRERPHEARKRRRPARIKEHGEQAKLDGQKERRERSSQEP